MEPLPLVEEDRWLCLLDTVPIWTPLAKPTLVIAPHPDDETLGAGGLIAAQVRRRATVAVVALTDGEAAYQDVPELSSVRCREQEQALNVLGVPHSSITRLRLSDSGLALQEQELLEKLEPLVTPDTLVIAPWPGDWHPDHEAAGRVARQACRQAGAELIFYLFWSWHRRTVDELSQQALLRFEYSDDISALKSAALACHRSQLQRDDGQPILPAIFLKPAQRSFEVFIRD